MVIIIKMPRSSRLILLSVPLYYIKGEIPF